MNETPTTSQERAVLAAFGDGFAQAYGEAHQRGWEHGFSAGQDAYRARVLASLEEDDQIPERLARLLRASD